MMIKRNEQLLFERQLEMSLTENFEIFDQIY